MSINTLPDPASQNQSGDFSETFFQDVNFFHSLIFHALFQLRFLNIAFAWLMSMWMGV